jgi:hypothetical protein
MKIKLTEYQYNRLLVENDKDFLDGKVEFPHIENKVNKFVVKLFNYIHQKEGPYVPSKNRDIHTIITRDFGLTNGEAKLLTHNYADLTLDGEVSDFNEFLGKPLEFYGEFKFNTRIPLSAYVNGNIDGWVTGHASSYEDFIEQLAQGDWEDIESDWSEEIDSFPEDAEWDIDSDYAWDMLKDEIADTKRHGDMQDVRDRIELM